MPIVSISSLASITPPSWHKESTKIHRNEHITARNSIDSYLHRLPTELLLEIDRYLGPEPAASSWSNAAARMALRATCRRFRSELSGPPGPGKPDANSSYRRWPTADRIAYSSVIRLARFRRLCADERAERLDGERLACFACRESHAKTCFTPAEQVREPEKRVCIGSQGLLEICPNYSVTHAGLCVRLRVRGIAFDNSNNYNIRRYYLHGGHVGMKVKVCSFKEQGRAGTKVEAVLSLGKIANNTDESILRALEEARWRVCPHVCSWDARTWQPLLKDAEKARTAWLAVCLGSVLKQCISRRTVPPNWSTRAHVCAMPYCDTRVTLFARYENAGDTGSFYLYLKTERCLGELRNGADGPKWLAQIVHPSDSEDDTLNMTAQESPGMLVKMVWW